MEAMLVLLGLVVLAIPIAVIYLLVGQSGLRTRIATLESELANLRGQATPAAQPNQPKPRLPGTRPGKSEQSLTKRTCPSLWQNPPPPA